MAALAGRSHDCRCAPRRRSAGRGPQAGRPGTGSYGCAADQFQKLAYCERLAWDLRADLDQASRAADILCPRASLVASGTPSTASSTRRKGPRRRVGGPTGRRGEDGDAGHQVIERRVGRELGNVVTLALGALAVVGRLEVGLEAVAVPGGHLLRGPPRRRRRSSAAADMDVSAHASS